MRRLSVVISCSANRHLVYHCMNPWGISTRCFGHRRVGAGGRCRRFASFHHLALRETSGTDCFKINATIYGAVLRALESMKGLFSYWFGVNSHAFHVCLPVDGGFCLYKWGGGCIIHGGGKVFECEFGMGNVLAEKGFSLRIERTVWDYYFSEEKTSWKK